jgi:predicted DNA-binding transcriptional regulator AlpA
MTDSKPYNPFESIERRLDRLERMIANLIEQRTQEMTLPDTRDGISLAIRVTGYSRKTIYNLVNKRLIPHFKKGGRLYFSEKDLLAWIDEGKRSVIEE